jgi:RIO kinase 1
MRFVGDADGPAPRLADLTLEPADARRSFDQSVRALAAIWRAGLVHGDYSTYNLLWWQGAVVVIDLPQAVEAQYHPEARPLLERDAASLCTSFRGHGFEASPERVVAAVLAGG